MRVIGTAGHVDHGKSTLVAALTGTHPDRLKEEQLREMTIDLGFGWMTLPNGEEIGIVDVPGHRDFIENMLSGVGGIDAVLLVIAADEGIMPQTKEHLAIVDLLQIPSGVIVLTKTDLADVMPEGGAAWLDLLEADVRAAVADSVLRDAPILRVSAKDNTGIDELKMSLSNLLDEKPARADLDRPRLPIDRVFTMSGFGTVVTGTLSDGHLSIGDEIEILPSGKHGRVRGLQTHKKKEERAVPGSRTAVNISGVEMEALQRGEVLVHPGQYRATRRVDVRLHVLGEAAASLKHADEVKFFVGASETVATVRLLGTDELKPGEDGWVQLELRDGAVTVRGDRFILRRPSPAETLGGGAIVEPQPAGRHKRFDEKVIQSLSALLQGSDSDVLLEAARALNVASAREVIAKSRLEPDAAQRALVECVERGELIRLEDDLVAARPNWNALRSRLTEAVDAYHAHYPLRGGTPREELKSKLKLTAQVFNAAVKKMLSEAELEDALGKIARPGREIKFEAGQQAKVQEVLRAFDASPYATPAVKECQANLGEEVFRALVDSGKLVVVSADVVFRKRDYDAMTQKIRGALASAGSITLAQTRDLFDTTRKYAQALLEHLDSIGVTARDGDVRHLRKK